MRHTLRRIAAAIAAPVLAAAVLVASPAAARPPAQAEITAYLATHPGGTQISPTEVSYDGGIFVVTFGRTTTTALTADCPSGWFCFYTAADYAGLMGKLSSCGWQDLARWKWNDKVVSAYYNMSSGYVDFIEHAAGYTVHTYDWTLFRISTSSPGLRLVPYPNRADHVNRHC